MGEEEIKDLEKRLAKLEERFKSLYGMDRSVSRIHDMRLTGVEERVDELSKKIEELESAVRALNEMNKTALVTVDRRLNNLEAKER